MSYRLPNDLEVQRSAQEAEVQAQPADALDLAVRLYRDVEVHQCIRQAALRSLERLERRGARQIAVRRLH